MTDKSNRSNNIYECIKILAPGTLLREALDNIVRAKTGALIVIGDSDEVMGLVDGGFNINSELTPAHLYELAKMDGAIILSYDTSNILYANTHLAPNPSIFSKETGIRHRTAERVAKQTGELVISISQRRNMITLYKGNEKHVLKDINEILTKANQAIQTLEKYKAVLNQSMKNLNVLEFEDLVTVYDVAKVLQRTEMVMRIVDEVKKYLLVLGNEGRLISMQMNELASNVDEDFDNIIKDYYVREEEIEHKKVKDTIKKLSSRDLLDLINIAEALRYRDGINVLDYNVSPKGYRVLNKIPRLPLGVLENVINTFESFQNILKAKTVELDAVEGIGEIRARMIKEGLRRFQEQSLLERHI